MRCNKICTSFFQITGLISLPNVEKLLHKEAYSGNSYPAAKAHDNRLASGFHQLDNVCVETDGCHGKDNKELAKLLNRGKNRGVHTAVYCNGCNDGSGNKIKDEKWKNLFHAYLVLLIAGFFFCPDKCQNQRDGDDGKGTG